MPLIAWRNEFATGIPDVDYEHFELIALINRLAEELEGEPAAEDVEAFLGEVHARISAHFALEEAAMRQCRYDQYDAHKAEHERLLDEIRDIMDSADSATEDLRRDLAETVCEWFAGHFRTHDARLHGKTGIK